MLLTELYSNLNKNFQKYMKFSNSKFLFYSFFVKSELKRRLKQENKAKEKEAKETLKAQTQPQNVPAKSAEIDNEADIDPNVTLSFFSKYRIFLFIFIWLNKRNIARCASHM